MYISITSMQHLCPQGADIVLTDVDGKTAVHWTANNPNDSTIKTLLVSEGRVTSPWMVMS